MLASIYVYLHDDFVFDKFLFRKHNNVVPLRWWKQAAGRKPKKVKKEAEMNYLGTQNIFSSGNSTFFSVHILSKHTDGSLHKN